MNKPSVSAGVVAGVALGAAALGAAAVAVRAACLQVARTRNGLARVKRVHDEGGDEVRVLVQGGVYQSASYVGERWAEPSLRTIARLTTCLRLRTQCVMLTGMVSTVCSCWAAAGLPIPSLH